jgi:photosystem II stability/assembly factor-like uncharacterized protein
MTTALAIGTLKGAWIARSDDGGEWDLEGPFLKGWQVNTFGTAPGGARLLTTGSQWYGAAVHRSKDLADWEQIVDGPAYPEESGHKLEQIWTLTTTGGDLYAGVAEAGLFKSSDDGSTWSPVAALNEHETRAAWMPGFGGLAAHRILVDSADPARMWVGISAVGVFATEDAGASWELRNTGVVATGPDDDFDIGYCVHGLVADPDDADTIWRQDHKGVYRTTDGGRSWERIQNGVPGAGFGFPIGRDDATGSLFIVPLEADEFRAPVDGRFAVYRSKDGGDSWAPSGDWPDDPTFDTVLRDSMATDGDGGVYVGTSGGSVISTGDAGDSWTKLPWTFPRIISVHAFNE